MEIKVDISMTKFVNNFYLGNIKQISFNTTRLRQGIFFKPFKFDLTKFDCNLYFKTEC